MVGRSSCDIWRTLPMASSTRWRQSANRGPDCAATSPPAAASALRFVLTAVSDCPSSSCSSCEKRRAVAEVSDALHEASGGQHLLAEQVRSAVAAYGIGSDL